jgi:methionine-rich copper-binding protein CopC
VFNRPATWLLAPVAALIVTVAIVPAVALAHAELATASPADKSTVSTPPSEIVFTFTEPLIPAKSSLKLVDAAGKIVAQDSTVDASDAKTMRLPVGPMPSGTYTVRWTTASALDGDIAHGTTTFTIVAASPSPSPSPSASEAPSPSPRASAESASPSASIAAPSPSPSGGTGTPTSTADAVIPVIVSLIVLAALGLWLLRSRSRRAG